MPNNAFYIEELNAIALADEEAEEESRTLPRRKHDEYGATAPSSISEEEGIAAAPLAEVTNKASPLYLVSLMLILILVGTTLTIVTKLQTRPMKNYPAALNTESVLVVSESGTVAASIPT